MRHSRATSNKVTTGKITRSAQHPDSTSYPWSDVACYKVATPKQKGYHHMRDIVTITRQDSDQDYLDRPFPEYLYPATKTRKME